MVYRNTRRKENPHVAGEQTAIYETVAHHEPV